jgi:formiminoglutamase
MSAWSGRTDPEDGPRALRWHQRVQPWTGDAPCADAAVMLGFACDAGVRRNRGRPGAAEGPQALRRALAGLALHTERVLLDGGDVGCSGDALEAAQAAYAARVRAALDGGAFVLALGGGHEIAWASFQGVAAHLDAATTGRRIGLLNFDAHFDLRSPARGASSGTPFRQVAAWCAAQDLPFRYAAIGISPVANTAALFDVARELGVRWVEDIDCREAGRAGLEGVLEAFLDDIDALCVSVCLDVFPAASAPGVSAPAALGIEPALVLGLLRGLGAACRRRDLPWLLGEVAELCPAQDIDARTARLTARVVHGMLAAQEASR